MKLTVSMITMNEEGAVAKVIHDIRSVAPDAEMPVGHLAGQRSGVVNALLEAVDVHVVVAQAVHLGELHSAAEDTAGPIVAPRAVRPINPSRAPAFR